MKPLQVNLTFAYDFNGQLSTDRHDIAVGTAEHQIAPYEMLLGALASCFYATFLEVAEKKKIKYTKVEITVTGEKRKDIPTTLLWGKLLVKVFNAEKESGIIKSAELAAKYCSIYQTLSHVADLSWDVEFY